MVWDYDGLRYTKEKLAKALHLITEANQIANEHKTVKAPYELLKIASSLLDEAHRQLHASIGVVLSSNELQDIEE